MNKPKILLTAICREPFRLFFPLGIVAATIGIGEWLLYALHVLARYSAFFHSSMQMMVYMNCFIVGFLTTALPRFTRTFTARIWEVGTFLILFIGITVFLGINEPVSAELLLLAWYVFLIYFVSIRLAQRQGSFGSGTAPKELIWVPLGLLNGIMGTILLILGQEKLLPSWALLVGKPMMDQGFLVCVVMGVGGFLIPRLMGTYEQVSNSQQEHEQVCTSQTGECRKPANIITYYLACALIFFISFFVEGFGNPPLGYGLRAIAITTVLLKSHILGKLPQKSGLYVWLAWGSIWMVAMGYWLACFFNAYQVIMLHITFIGGFSLMTFAVGSMVVMSHAGQGERLNAPLWVLYAVAVGIILALLNRLAVGLFPDFYFQILGFSAICWIMGAWAWLIFMVPRLMTVPAEDEFGRMHEQVNKKT